MVKKYNFGVICGRFQPLHNGHCSIIQAAIEQCDRVAVFIGSAQEYHTRKNPFTYYQRKEFLKREFGNQIEVYPINDLTDGTEVNGEWGRYFLKTVYNYTGLKPGAIFSGAESIRDKWFYEEDIKYIDIINISRSMIPISATKIRNLFLNKQYDIIKEYVPEAVYSLKEDIYYVLKIIDEGDIYE